jgi:hypothetical protein
VRRVLAHCEDAGIQVRPRQQVEAPRRTETEQQMLRGPAEQPGLEAVARRALVANGEALFKGAGHIGLDRLPALQPDIRIDPEIDVVARDVLAQEGPHEQRHLGRPAGDPVGGEQVHRGLDPHDAPLSEPFPVRRPQAEIEKGDVDIPALRKIPHGGDHAPGEAEEPGGEEQMSEQRNGSDLASPGEGLTPGPEGKTTTTRDPATDETVSTGGGRSEAEGESEGPGDARAESDYRSPAMPEGVPQDAPEAPSRSPADT